MTEKMKCSNCKKEFPENEIEESHDVPCYLFPGNRRIRKQVADKHGRRWLCKKCHKKYEVAVNVELVIKAKEFAKRYFNEK